MNLESIDWASLDWKLIILVGCFLGLLALIRIASVGVVYLMRVERHLREIQSLVAGIENNVSLIPNEVVQIEQNTRKD